MKIRECICGCGETWDVHAEDMRSQRMRRYAPQCKRADAPSPRKEGTIVPCGCGRCGLTYPTMRGRRFAPDCPTKEAERKRHNNASHKRRNDAKRAAAGLPPVTPDMYQRRACQRCKVCEGLSHRRPLTGCDCDQPYAPEAPIRARAPLASSAGMVLRC